MMPDIKIDITHEEYRFNDFLKIEDNHNIIFSGKFGIGKTYFLKDFFNSHAKEYNYIYLSPVNYSISSNEDIFEYIKCDVLFELLSKVTEFESINFSLSLRTQMAIANNFDNLFISIASVAEKIKFGTNALSSLFKALKKAKETFDIKGHDQEEEALKILYENKQKTGSIFEENATTDLIKSLISNLKNEDKDKPVVLLIDDLDRIDPEHIFRIMNVFSAHEDFYHNGEHKFGLDKTILVCDINNIKNVFKNRYGIDVDFNGYIDKFYSNEIFYFNNTDNIINQISEYIATIKIGNSTPFRDPENGFSQICKSILASFLNNGFISLRTLIKCYNKFIPKNAAYIPTRSIYRSSIRAILLFDFLASLFVDNIELESALSKLNDENFDKYTYIGDLIFLADYKNNNLLSGDFKYKGLSYSAIYLDREIMVKCNNDGYVDMNNLIMDCYKSYIELNTKFQLLNK